MFLSFIQSCSIRFDHHKYFIKGYFRQQIFLLSLHSLLILKYLYHFCSSCSICTIFLHICYHNGDPVSAGFLRMSFTDLFLLLV